MGYLTDCILWIFCAFAVWFGSLDFDENEISAWSFFDEDY
jgi:hypothetical protein